MMNHRETPSIGINALYNIIYQLLNAVFPLVSAGYVARVLAPAGVGKVGYAQNIVSYFVMIATLGISAYATREIARVREDPQKRDLLFSELMVLNGICIAICMAAYGALVRGVFRAEALLYAAVGLELVFHFLNMDWFYQGMEEYGHITARSLAVKACALILLFVFVKDGQDYILYGLIHSVGIGLNYLISFCCIRNRVNFCWRGLNLKHHLKSLGWLAVVMASGSLYSKIDITMLGTLCGPESVAYYSNAHKAIGIVLSLVTAVSAVFMPRLSYVFVNRREEFADYVATGVKIVLLLAVPACAGMIMVAEDVVTILFGQKFLPAGSVLQILSVFTIVKGTGDILCYQLIIASGNEHKLIKSRICGTLVNVVLNAVLIPLYGHVGAAVASVIGEIIVNSVMLPVALSVVKIRLRKRFVFSILISTAAMVTILYMLQPVLEIGMIRLVLTVLGGITVYGTMLIITRNEFLRSIMQKKSAWKQD